MLRLTLRITIGLILLALSRSALAAGTTDAATFGTVEDWSACEVQGGTWRTDGRGRTLRCYIAGIPESECFKRGGRWQRFAFESSSACQVPHPDDRELIECHRLGGEWGTHGGRVEHCFYAAKRSECLTQGGKWIRVGRSGISTCMLRMLDGGKPCTSSSQCEHQCDAIAQPDPLDAPVVGQCSAYNIPYRGCASRVENGRYVRAPICD